METAYSKAWAKWRKSLEGRGCSDATTLSKTHLTPDVYLENRLKLVFAAAWNARGNSTVIDFGCWYCRLGSWFRHRLGRCGAWCAHCITEAEEQEFSDG